MTLTATVTPNATGKVLFSDAGAIPGSAPVIAGQATFSTRFLRSGVQPYVSAGWSGDASGTANPLQFTMDGPKTITALFHVPGFTCELNSDNLVTPEDIQLLLCQALSGATTSDLNHDGAVNIPDAQKMVNAAMGLGCLW